MPMLCEICGLIHGPDDCPAAAAARIAELSALVDDLENQISELTAGMDQAEARTQELETETARLEDKNRELNRRYQKWERRAQKGFLEHMLAYFFTRRDKVITGLREDNARLEARKDGAYKERNQVVAALARLFPSGVTKTDIPGWDNEWHGCVYIDLPTGQASWHFHDSQSHLFDGLPPYEGEWDGHDTPEKYRRVAVLSGNGSRAADVLAAAREYMEAMRSASLNRAELLDILDEKLSAMDAGEGDDG